MNIFELSLTGSTKCLLLTNIVASGVMSSENICVIMKKDSDKKIALTEMQTSQTPIETKVINSKVVTTSLNLISKVTVNCFMTRKTG